MPASRAATWAPRATSTNMVLLRSMTTRPMVRDRPAASERAFAFRTKPSSSMASCTLAIVEALTLSGWFSTFDTVPSETPASSATSAMLGRRPCRVITS